MAKRSKPKQRFADRPRGPNPYPHWHDSPAWAKKATLKRSQFLKMSPEEFADWVLETHRNAPTELEAFFYGMKWPEGYTYCVGSRSHCIAAYEGFKLHRRSWPTPLLDTED